MKFIILLLLLTFISSSVKSQSDSTKSIDSTKGFAPGKKLTLRENPKIEIGGLAGQFTAGYSLGLLGALILTGALYGVGGGSSGHGGPSGVYGVLLIGHCIGSIFGVNIGDSRENVSGNFWLSIAGGAAGTAGSFLYLSDNAKLGDFFIAATFPTLGAMIGYNSMLRYNDKKNVSEIKNFGSHLKMKNDFEINFLKIDF